MQAAQAAIPYLQNTVSVKKDYASTESRSSRKDSFSDTLKKGLSKETEPVADNVQGQEQTVGQREETAPETQMEPQMDGVVIPIMQNMVQNPYIPQEAAGETAMPVLDAADVEISVIPAGQQLETQGSVAMEMADMGSEDGAAEALPKQAMVSQLRPVSDNAQAQPVAQQKTTDAQPEQSAIQQPVASAEKTAEAQPNQARQDMGQQAGQGQQQAGAETGNGNATETQASLRQDAGAFRPIAFETPQAFQQTSVDMTNARTGVQNLARAMADNMTAGKSEFEIWLEPANLGKMAIKVAYENGRAMVSIMCTNEKTMELMSQNARHLGNILQQHTGDETVVVIDQPESDYLQQKTDQEDQNGQQQEEQDGQQDQDQQDQDHESFLQQLRLGLM